MGVIGILFLFVLFTGIVFVIHRWCCERRKENDAAQQQHQPASTTCSAHTTQPTKPPRQQESPQSEGYLCLSIRTSITRQLLHQKQRMNLTCSLEDINAKT